MRLHPLQARRVRLEHLAHRPGARHRAHQPAQEDARARHRAALIGLLVLFAAGTAAADPIEDRFNAAANRIAADQYQEAAADLEALASEAPDHRLAPEALFSAAEIREERLADPAAALALYDRLVKSYPDSRPAMAAGRRAEKLRKLVGEGQEGLEPQRRFTEIREGFPDRPESESIAMTEALLAEHPDWVGAPTVAMWLAELDLRSGRLEAAMRRYAAVAERWPDGEARFDALLGAGDAAMQLGLYDRADDYYDLLETGGDPSRETLRREAISNLDRLRARTNIAIGAWIVALCGILALVASIVLATRSARGSLRTLWPPPTEVLYIAPVAAFLSATAHTGFEGLGPSVVWISLAGVVVAWLSGAGLSARAAGSPARRIAAVGVHVAASIGTVVAVAYLAILEYRLIDPVLDTLRFGPDR